MAQPDTTKLSRLLDTLETYNRMMGAVAIRANGAIRYQKAIGFADRARALPNTPETRFRIGSITKTFTAVLVFQLIEAEKLSPEDKLYRFFPELDPEKTITIDHLLRHRSGLANFTDEPEYLSYMSEPKSREEMIAIIKPLGKDFAPGEQYAYSNTNYYLLGQIIEIVSGKTYAEQLRTEITEPLALKNTYVGKEIGNRGKEAFSYVKNAEQEWEKFADETDMSIPHGAGAMVSTTDDLLRFITGLFDDKLLSVASLQKMTDTEQGYGAGLMKFPFYDTFAYGHNGGIDGFQSNLAYFPEKKVASVVLANGLNYPMNDVLIGVLSCWFGKSYEIPDLSREPVTVAADVLKSYAGIYRSEGFPLAITLSVSEEGALMAQATGQSAFPLTAYSETRFEFEPAGIVIEFEDEKTFLFQQGGGQFTFKRE